MLLLLYTTYGNVATPSAGRARAFMQHASVALHCNNTRMQINSQAPLKGQMWVCFGPACNHFVTSP
jgi:hypothetical protein